MLFVTLMLHLKERQNGKTKHVLLWQCLIVYK